MQRKERSDKGIKRVDVSMPRSEATAWRHADEGKYNDKPVDRSYFRTYYIEKCQPHETCPFCGVSTVRCKLARHQKTKRCTAWQLRNEHRLELERLEQEFNDRIGN